MSLIWIFAKLLMHVAFKEVLTVRLANMLKSRRLSSRIFHVMPIDAMI